MTLYYHCLTCNYNYTHKALNSNYSVTHRMRDFYHTCYCLSGLSVAQHCYGTNNTVTISLDPETVLVSVHNYHVYDLVPCYSAYYGKTLR